jgi:hypothetical protein
MMTLYLAGMVWSYGLIVRMTSYLLGSIEKMGCDVSIHGRCP